MSRPEYKNLKRNSPIKEGNKMLCPKCKSETFIDHVTVNDGVTTYSYVCVNPRCEEYRKAFTLTGVEAEATIEGAK